MDASERDLAERSKADARVKLRHRRHPETGKSADDLLRIVRKNLHPRLTTCGIAYVGQAEEQRKDVGIHRRHGTLWFATSSAIIHSQAIPLDEVPYWPALEGTMAKDDSDTRFQEKGPVAGWRRILRDLVVGGFLRPGKELDFLTGEDTWALNRDSGFPCL